MSRLIRLTAAAALAAAVFAPAAASAAPPVPCDVTIEDGKIGGTTWTATYVYPKVTCS